MLEIIVLLLCLCAAASGLYGWALRFVQGARGEPPAPRGATVAAVIVLLEVWVAVTGLLWQSAVLSGQDAWLTVARDYVALVLVVAVLLWAEGDSWQRQVMSAGPVKRFHLALCSVLLYLPLRVAVDAAYAATVLIADLLHYQGPTSHVVLERIAQGVSQSEAVALVISAALITPVLEELVFRACLYGWLCRHLNPALAAVLSGLIFGLLHLPWVLQPAMMLLGFLLAMGYRRSGTLMLPIALHVLLNTQSVVVALLR